MLKIKFYRFLWHISVYALCFLMMAVTCAAQDNAKMKPEEIVAKHLAAIGTPEMLASVSSRIIAGKSQARDVKATITTVAGQSVLASTKDQSLLKMKFNVVDASDYSREEIIFDGKKVNAPFITESQRSALGSFLFSYSEIVKQGLFGGSLNATWALLDAKSKISKFIYEGKEKISGKEVYVLRCVPRGGSALTIKLYFDAQTFQHVRTTYYQVITSPITTADQGLVSETRYKLEEDFSAYKKISGLTLPTNYKINYTIETPSRLNQFEWLLKFSQFTYNQELKSELFQ